MTTSAGAGTGLAGINHIVVLMLENRSFDHMLGYLYADAGNVSPAGQPFEGLTGNESNPDASGNPVSVYQITPSTPNAYFMPGADPGEGYKATNDQLWGSDTAPASGTAATMQGFVKDFAYTIGWETSEKWSIIAGTTASDIMGCFTPQTLPVLSALAKGYAVCDHWFASAPTETLPNRAFALAGTSQGHMDDKTKTYTCPSIFGSLTTAGVSWTVFGYDAQPLTKADFPDITNADPSHFGLFTDFQAAAAAGTLPAFTFLEPSWSSTGNSQHPNYDVALGEQLIHDTYEALRSGPGWPQTLFVLTYDEHGGCYDHVPPPWGATPPDNTAGEFGFGFDRFGVRVPTLLISPLIAPGTVYRVPAGADAARPHLRAQDDRAALEHPGADRPRRGGPRLRRRPHPDDPAHRRRPRRRHRPGLRQRGPVRRPGLPPGGDPRRALRQLHHGTPARRKPATAPEGAPVVVQDPDQRPPQGVAPRAVGVTAQVIQDPDQLPS